MGNRAATSSIDRLLQAISQRSAATQSITENWYSESAEKKTLILFSTKVGISRTNILYRT